MAHHLNDDASSITDTYMSSAIDLDDDIGIVSSTDVFIGRRDEVKLLMAAYQRVLTNHGAEVVFVHGASGSGKTSLVKKLHEMVMATRGYFTTGKYFQNSGMQEPYSAIMAAFSDLCDVVTLSSDLTEERRREIQQALGSDGKLLTKSISNLAGFLSADDDEIEVAGRDGSAYARFKVACKTFLHTMASEEHPLVLFIDDIQWMDDGSRELLRLLLRDPELKNVMLVLAYRDEESENLGDILAEEPAMQALDIYLGDLCSGDVLELITTIMKTTKTKTGATTDPIVELARLVESKTNGNPFYVVQFLETIQHEGLLTYNLEASSWKFDIERIQREIMISDSIADLLQMKIRRLSKEVQDTLMIASMLGFVFCPDVLGGIFVKLNRNNMKLSGHEEERSSIDWAKEIKDKVMSSVAIAARDGFVEPTKGGYQFSHDKLQASFQSEVPLQDRGYYHLCIGETFLEFEADGHAGCDSTYNAAVHLNLAPTFAVNTNDQLRLAVINLKAAEVCKEKSAFVVAAELFRNGLALIPEEDKWERHFDLTFELTESLARMEFIIGNFDKCKEITKETLARGKSPESMINTYLIDVEVRMAEMHMNGTTIAARRALSALGIKMKRKPGLRHLVMKLLKVRRLMRNKTDEDVLNMPRMTDASISTATKILLHVFSHLMLQDEDTQASYYALMAVEFTFKHGISPYSACAFVSFGMVELSIGNHDRGYRLGKLAMKLLDKIKCNDAECPTVGLSLALLTHWKEPIAEAPERLLEAAEKGFAAGDVLYGTYCLSMIYAVGDLVGRNLEELESFMRITYQRICDLSQDGIVMWVQAGIQYVLNLRTSGANWHQMARLDGEVMNEAEYMRTASDANYHILIVLAWVYKAQMACLFRQYATSISIYKDIRSMGPAFRLSFGIVSESFFAALAYFGNYRETGRRHSLRMARRYNKFLLGVAKHGCPTPVPHISFLQAEELSVRKGADVEEVVAAYEQAIDAMGKVGFVHLEALGHEQLGFYLASSGHKVDAAKHVDLALTLWMDGWGAVAKYEWLEEKSAAMLPSEELDVCDNPGVRVGDVICVSKADRDS